MRSLAAGGLAALTVWTAAATWQAWLAAPARARAARLRRHPSQAAAFIGVELEGGGVSAQGRIAAPARTGLRWLAGRLADAAVPGHPRRWAALWVGLLAAGASAGAQAGGPALAALALLAAMGGPWLALGARRGRGSAAVEAALPPVLEATARGLRAGASLPVALAAAASGAAPAVAGDLAELAAGAPRTGLVVALDQWAAVRPLPGVRLAAAALALAAEVGGGARALDGVALTLRQRLAAAAEVRALATQARLSAVVLTVAPLAFAALAAAGDPATASALLRAPVGHVCLALGLALDAVGAAWMARITRGGGA